MYYRVNGIREGYDAAPVYNKSNNNVLLYLTILLILLGIGGGYYYLKNQKVEQIKK